MNLDEAFKLIANKLTEEKIPWWLEYGSLLGAIRDGKRIEWDDDYDIGYPLEYAPKVLKALLNIDKLEVCSNLYFQVRNKKEEYHICLEPHTILNGEMYEIGENKILKCLNVGDYFLYPFLRSLPFYLQKLLVRSHMKAYRLIACKGTLDDYSTFIVKDMGEVPSFIPIGYDNILKTIYGDYMTPRKDKITCYKDGNGLQQIRKKSFHRLYNSKKK